MGCASSSAAQRQEVHHEQQPLNSAKMAPPPKVLRSRSHSISQLDRDEEQPFDAPVDTVRAEVAELKTLTRATHFDSDTITKLYDIYVEVATSQIEDGIVDANEFAMALGLSSKSTLCVALFNTFNVSRSQMLTFREFARTLSALSPHASEREKMKVMFDSWDLNGDGLIDRAEVVALLEAALAELRVKADLQLSPEEVNLVIQRTFQEMDTDANGAIDFDEYCAHKSLVLPFLTLDVEKLLHQRNQLTPTSSPQIHHGHRRLSSTTIELRRSKMRDTKSRQAQLLGLSPLNISRRLRDKIEEETVVEVQDIDELFVS